jgi:transposase
MREQQRDLYAAIDLHSNNNYLAIIDGEDHRVFERRLKNEISAVITALAPFKERVVAIAVESTFNWYWLVDGLEDAGYRMRLVNTAAVRQYEGLKHSDDRHDAFWLAHLMRLGILPTGHIHPREHRALRDLLRKRMRLVQQRTANILSIQNLQQRNEGVRMTTNQIKAQTAETIAGSVSDPNRAMALRTTQSIILALDEQICQIESEVLRQVRPDPIWKLLKTVWGIGPILATTIRLETGELGRFAQVGDFVSYCRCVKSERTSNGKKKGEGNTKNGNRYLSWAFIEAANFAIRDYQLANRDYHRKASKTNVIVARKALAHKLARASFFVMRDQTCFVPERLFG